MNTSLRFKIAQMFLMGFDGLSLDSHSTLKNWITTLGIGGVILFDKNIKTPHQSKNIFSYQQVGELNQAIQRASIQNTMGLPSYIAVDYEGGAVDRFRCIKENGQTLSPYALSQLPSKVYENHLINMARFLKGMHFNLNFAPLVDLSLTTEKGIIGKLDRSFSNHPSRVIDMAKRWIAVFQANGIMSCLKHFPGHGSAVGDTHVGLVDVTDTFSSEELVPYHALAPILENGFVMTAHVVNRNLDVSDEPMTFSYAMLTHLLKTRYRYKGLVISDDIQMHALSTLYSIDDILVKSILAGNDMLIVGNQLGESDPFELVERVLSLVLKKHIPVACIHRAYANIVSHKERCLNPTLSELKVG